MAKVLLSAFKAISKSGGSTAGARKITGTAAQQLLHKPGVRN